ncbi:MAG: hypothetical protein NXI31_26420 [bacterium]|nr:hypothetical protein [bacterium]
MPRLGLSTGLLAVALALGSGESGRTTPKYRFERNGDALTTRIIAITGEDQTPLPGDVLDWPLLVIDDVEDQVFEQESSERVWRLHEGGRQLVAIEVREPGDLAALTDAEARGLRRVSIDRWQPAMAAELVRIDPRSCLLEFGPLVDAIDLSSLPATCRYLHMHYADPVDPRGFARFRELRYLALPNEAWVPESDEPPSPEWGAPGATMPLDWVHDLPQLRWLDSSEVCADLRPLGGHPTLRTVIAKHCRITHLPTVPLPRLHEFVTWFSDVPAGEVERLRHDHPNARIQVTSTEALHDRIANATELRFRTGSSCHPKPDDRVLFTTKDPTEIGGLLAILQPEPGFQPRFSIPGCGQGVLQFFDANGTRLAETSLIGLTTLRSHDAWGLQPACLTKATKAALQAWLTARRLPSPH